MKAATLFGGLVLVSASVLAGPDQASPWPPSATAVGSEHIILLAQERGDNARKKWETMSQEERDAIRARRQQYESLPPSEQERIKKIHDRYQQLSPEERRELQEKWRQQRGQQAPSDRRSRGRD